MLLIVLTQCLVCCAEMLFLKLFGHSFWQFIAAKTHFFNASTLMSLLSPRVQVEFYVNENTFKERLKLFFIKNQRSSKYKPRGSVAAFSPLL